MTEWEMLLRVATGVGLGTVIGIERQYRSRRAGLRTNALVAVGSTLFVLLSAHGFGPGSVGTPDPTRVAAQIVSGIGFLGGGVILRDGFSVRGLNTAATLWCTAAVGALAGAGLYSTAVVGTAAVVVVNVLLRLFARQIDRFPASEQAESEDPAVIYEVVAVVKTKAAVRVRAQLLQTLGRSDFQLISMTSTETDHDGLVEVRAEFSAEHREDRQLEVVTTPLGLEPSVSSVRWGVRPENDEHEEQK
ncbi:MgtC/SapB family protein [Segniliparus rotundus]|nr:MgtC/SapB family protein [Segniliparus rotundus]